RCLGASCYSRRAARPLRCATDEMRIREADSTGAAIIFIGICLVAAAVTASYALLSAHRTGQGDPPKTAASATPVVAPSADLVAQPHLVFLDATGNSRIYRVAIAPLGGPSE